MLPGLKDFVDAMKASCPVATAIFLGSATLLICHALGVWYVQDIPNWVLTVAFVVMLFAAANVIVTAIQTIYGAAKRLLENRRAARLLEKHVEQINELPTEEIDILMWAAVNRRQVFNAPLNHPLLEPLIAKGYVKPKGGVHDLLAWPHAIPDHVWQWLKDNRDTFPKKVPNPFVDEW